MRNSLCLVALLGCTGCPVNVQQHAAFKHAEVSPQVIERPVGDIVRFEVRPPVALGTHWLLDAHGLARFVGQDGTHIDWVADGRPIVLESVVAPWNPARSDVTGGRGWLWFSVPEGTGEALEKDLPARPVPYHEVAPVTFSSAFSLAPRDPRLSVTRNSERVTILYHTPIDSGTPHAPRLGAMLLETVGRKILYAEVKTNFGEREKDRVGYDVTFSYAAAAVPDPVEVVVVEWIGHGLYTSAFDVHRLVIGAPPP